MRYLNEREAPRKEMLGQDGGRRLRHASAMFYQRSTRPNVLRDIDLGCIRMHPNPQFVGQFCFLTRCLSVWRNFCWSPSCADLCGFYPVSAAKKANAMTQQRVID